MWGKFVYKAADIRKGLFCQGEAVGQGKSLCCIREKLVQLSAHLAIDLCGYVLANAGSCCFAVKVLYRKEKTLAGSEGGPCPGKGIGQGLFVAGVKEGEESPPRSGQRLESPEKAASLQAKGSACLTGLIEEGGKKGTGMIRFQAGAPIEGEDRWQGILASKREDSAISIKNDHPFTKGIKKGPLMALEEVFGATL